MHEHLIPLITSLMPGDARLYNPDIHGEWEHTLLATEGGTHVQLELAYVIVRFPGKPEIYAPFIAPGVFLLPPDGEYEFDIQELSEADVIEYVEKRKRRQKWLLTIFLLLVLTTILVPIWRQHQWQQDMEQFNEGLISQQYQEQQTARDNSSLLGELQSKLDSVAASANGFAILTNSDKTLSATLLPALTSFYGNQHIVGPLLGDPVDETRAFLRQDSDIGYKLLLQWNDSEQQLLLGHYYPPAQPSDSGDALPPSETPSLIVNVLKPATDEHIQELLDTINSPFMTTKEDLFQVYPLLAQGYYLKHYNVSAEELRALTEHPGKSINPAEDIYFISVSDLNLPLSEQQRLSLAYLNSLGVVTPDADHSARWQTLSLKAAKSALPDWPDNSAWKID
ncbi:hypothetical protein L2725_04030 [Shewanella corallii]|uniref:Uncharacterized protein n=1 Tax=Shewanella corallii TaxID=560080 RepID=A0ABT0N569_9GAMM|nr:hypothetical protein [Shewanella corallii]MCL2912952.1 hypothetical protein [Shewanella corallii]